MKLYCIPVACSLASNVILSGILPMAHRFYSVLLSCIHLQTWPRLSLIVDSVFERSAAKPAMKAEGLLR